MKALVILALVFATATAAEAKGCLTGALAGGVAGHYVHHTVTGAIAGCYMGHHIAHQKQPQSHQPQVAPAQPQGSSGGGGRNY